MAALQMTSGEFSSEVESVCFTKCIASSTLNAFGSALPRLGALTPLTGFDCIV